MITGFLEMIPPNVTSQEKGVRVVRGRPRFFKKREIEAVEHLYRQALAPFVPEHPLDGPLVLAVWWFWPWRKSDRDQLREPFKPKDTKPDTDNALKLFKDTLARMGFMTEDGRVAFEKNEKYWGYHPGIAFRLGNAHADGVYQTYAIHDPSWFLHEWAKLEPPEKS